jgi:ubiquinone/menaquinone biosynthesis C-methylase UbiE
MRWLLLAAGVLLAVVGLALAPAVVRMDLGKLGSRAAWQLPDRVLDSLRIQSGDRVADVGAGDGYFTFRLATAVGPPGRVYAVEVDDALVAKLEQKAREAGHANVVVVRGEYADPLLPDGAVDLVLVCNTYHHIEDRVTYFDRLRGDLAEGGRVALIDLKATFLVALFTPHGHWTTVETMREEMGQASYVLVEELDYLPAQSFVVFRPR